MKYHIVLGNPFDLEGINQDAQAGKRPRHVMWGLSQQLGAAVHQPGGNPVSLLDKVLAKITSRPEHWALVRSLSSELTSEDLVFCTGEDVGLPLGILCGFKGERPKLVVTVMAPERPRVRAALKLFSLANSIDLFMTNTRLKADFLRKYLNLSDERVYVLSEQTDTKFFTPGSASPDKSRPMIASAGREQRDYQTLAEATRDLDVDVKVCALAPNPTAKTRVPQVIPNNMSFHPYDWPEFAQLYRDADVVVVSLLYSTYSPGLTSLMEAMASRRPVVITRTPGLAEELIKKGVVIGVNPGDPNDMQQGILKLLNNPQEAQAQAQRGYELLQKEHTSEQHIENLISEFQKLTSSSFN
ncbi:MAG: glycosyltransferase family 4 protein [Symploca sp. SIO2C1]|nr:glycosyltransferase family 4 protein [Symploca sp. SIO2C1]